MKTVKFLTALSMMMTVTACAEQTMPIIGGQQDEYGCLPAAGYSWSVLKLQCVQPFQAADIRFADPDDDTLAVYVILSEDKQQAEVFKADLPTGTIFTAVKGGYVSQDGKTRLLKSQSGWRLRK